MFDIAGVTGRTGSIVANTLLAAGKPVRVIVRDAAKGDPWRAQGAEVAVASVDDRAALGAALRGATAAYLLLPPGSFTQTDIPAERARTAAAIIGAVADARPGQVVQLSSIGADLPSGTGPIQFVHPLERGLRETGVPVTFLRASFFMDNWDALIPGALASGALYYGIDTRFSQVATADIGQVAARLLLEPPPTSPRIVELAGPEDLTLAETAAAFAKAGGKPVAAVPVPPAAMVESLVGMGASRELAALYGEMAGAITNGTIAWRGTPERGTTTLEAHARAVLSRS